MNTPARSSIPNGLTILRLVLAVAFPFIPESWRLPVILVALTTEYLDGALARKWNVISPFGQLLDPIADKLFVAVTAVILIVEGHLTILQVFLVALRDLTVLAGGIWLAARKNWGRFTRLEPKFTGKIATTGQFATLIAFYADLPFASNLLVATIGLSCIAAIHYVYLFVTLSDVRPNSTT